MIKSLDWDRDRISLSLRETLPNPWDSVAERFQVGSIHKGTVSRLTAFGAFVTLEPGVDGLLHISKLGSGRKLHHPREVVEVGQELAIKIESVDMTQKRLALAPEDYEPESKKTREKTAPRTPLPVKEPDTMRTFGDLFAKKKKKKRK